MVVLSPVPVKVYQTPKLEVLAPAGGVSETAYKVAPARFDVPQGRAVALAQTSLAGGVGAGHEEH